MEATAIAPTGIPDGGAEAADQAAITGGAAGPETILSVPTSELVRLGIVSNKGMVVLGGALGILWQQGDAWELDWWTGIEERVQAGRSWLDAIAATPWLAAVITAVTIFALGVVTLRLLSVGWFILQFHGFTLAREKDRIHVDYGLVNRVSRTVPTARIQALKTAESPLHRWFGRQSIELQTVGGGGEDFDVDEGAFKTTIQWLAPMIATERVPALVAEVFPGVEIATLAWQPIAAGAWRRVFKRWITVTTLVIVPAAIFFHGWILALLVPAAPFAYTHARLYAKHTGYALAPWGIVARVGWWNRRTTIIRYGKIQTVSRSQSPFDRRRAMASVQIDAAGGEMFGHTVDIPYLDASVAARLGGRLYAEASRRAYRF